MSTINRKNRKGRERRDTSMGDNVSVDNAPFVALSPEDEIKNGQEYMVALDWALDRDNVYNVAISGPYGSGKSSVLKSYFKSRGRNDVLNISLAAFNLEEMKVEEQQSNAKLQAGILKQLFYKVAADKIPESRYRKIQPNKKGVNIFLAALFALLIVGILAFIVNDIYIFYFLIKF